MGTVIVVTGASAGIGRAVVRLFAQQLAQGDPSATPRIALLARGAGGLAAAQREVQQLGAMAIAIPCDVADAAAVESAATVIEQELGPIDVWVNNAMVSMFARAWEMSAAEFDRVTRVTYLGAVHGTLSALSRMRARDRGVIVQVGSLLELRSIPLQSAYCAAKHALAGFTESLRCELLNEGSNVRVTTVQLPAVNTPQFSWVRTTLPLAPQPMGTIYQPEVAARAIVDAALDNLAIFRDGAADHKRRKEADKPRTLVGGSLLGPWLLQKLAPGLLDRILAKRGVEGQMGKVPLDDVGTGRTRSGNLFAPLDAVTDAGAHGGFDARAKSTSLQLWANRRRGGLLTVAALALAGIAAAALAPRWVRGHRRTSGLRGFGRRARTTVSARAAQLAKKARP